MNGSQFAASIFGMVPGDPGRRKAIDAAVSAGHALVWPLVPVPIGNGDHVLVSSDYFAIGDPSDFLRLPLNAHEAQSVADRLGMLLPTTKVVDLAWQNAGQRLAPIGLVRTAEDAQKMMSTQFAVNHQQAIQRAGAKFGPLVAGTKKDVVLSNQLADFRPNAVAFYGWHRPDGTPIQQNAAAPDKASTAHEASYADYSHGVRLVAPLTTKGRKVSDLYRSGELNYGGPLRVLRYGAPAEGPSGPSKPIPPGDVPTPAPAAAVPARPPSGAAKVGSDAWARGILISAWLRHFNAAPTSAAIQAVQAIARGVESAYGGAAGGPKTNNWGSIRCGMQPPCGPGCAEIGQPGELGAGCYKVYPTPEDGASDFVRILLIKRPTVFNVIGSGSAMAIASEMKATNYFELATDRYADGIAVNAAAIAKAIGEPLLVTLNGTGHDVGPIATPEAPSRPKAEGP